MFLARALGNAPGELPEKVGPPGREQPPAVAPERRAEQSKRQSENIRLGKGIFTVPHRVVKKEKDGQANGFLAGR